MFRRKGRVILIYVIHVCTDYALTPKPEILGREAEGTIISLGPSGNFFNLKVGDRAVFLGTSSYAEYTCAPAAKTHIVPENIKPSHAAASLLQGLTALTFIRESHPVKEGEWTLVHAAAGGVGLWLVQLLKAVGAKVIGTASTDEKIKEAKEAGADFMINYTTEDIAAKVKEITSSAGPIAIFDGVGKSTFDLDLDIIARKGTLVSFGNASGAVPPFPIAKLSGKNVKLLRPTLFNYVFTREEYEHYVAELWGFMGKKGWRDVKIHEIYPLSEVRRATEDLEGRRTMGKLLMKP